MRHTKTPSDPGWYWVANQPDAEDGWQMVFWDSEADEPRLYSFSPEIIPVMGLQGHRGVSVWREEEGGGWEDVEGGLWRGPEVWVGPLQQPGGPFGSTIAEFEEETYREARRRKHAMVMTHIDYTQCPGHAGGTVTWIDVWPPEEVEKA